MSGFYAAARAARAPVLTLGPRRRAGRPAGAAVPRS